MKALLSFLSLWALFSYSLLKWRLFYCMQQYHVWVLVDSRSCERDFELSFSSLFHNSFISAKRLQTFNCQSSPILLAQSSQLFKLVLALLEPYFEFFWRWERLVRQQLVLCQASLQSSGYGLFCLCQNITLKKANKIYLSSSGHFSVMHLIKLKQERALCQKLNQHQVSLTLI